MSNDNKTDLNDASHALKILSAYIGPDDSLGQFAIKTINNVIEKNSNNQKALDRLFSKLKECLKASSEIAPNDPIVKKTIDDINNDYEIVRKSL
jgi:hypothetical protein